MKGVSKNNNSLCPNRTLTHSFIIQVRIVILPVSNPSQLEGFHSLGTAVYHQLGIYPMPHHRAKYSRLTYEYHVGYVIVNDLFDVKMVH